MVVGGPSVVAIGGGHGVAQTLQAARRYAGKVTAVVSVADDGGSSGRLREGLGIPAPGDLRRCIGALLPGGSALAEALEHRFDGGELAGHAFGNILIATLAATSGDFTRGVAEAARILGAVGEVIPATTEPVVLKGLGDAGELAGQMQIKEHGGISKVALVPADAEPPPRAVEAILGADQVVIGPGSLFTSLLAATIVPGISQAISETRAQRVYVANLLEQVPETAGYDVAAHVEALLDHGVEIDVVLVTRGALTVGAVRGGVVVEEAELASKPFVAHHPALLAQALSDLVLARLPGAGEK